MTRTAAFLAKVKKQLGRRIPAAEIEQFSAVGAALQLGTLYVLAQAFALIMHGRKGSEEGFRKIVFWGIVLAVCTPLTPTIATAAAKKIKALLEYDATLTPVQREFPQFNGESSEVITIILTNGGLLGVLLALLRVGNLHTAEDLIVDVTGITSELTLLRAFCDATRVYTRVKGTQQLREKDRPCLQLLRDIAERHQLVASFGQLPDVPPKIVKTTSVKKELAIICDAILRFPVRDELSVLYDSSKQRLEEFLADISDFFVDHPVGSVRRTGLSKFPRYCRKYYKLACT